MTQDRMAELLDLTHMHVPMGHKTIQARRVVANALDAVWLDLRPGKFPSSLRQAVNWLAYVVGKGGTP